MKRKSVPIALMCLLLCACFGWMPAQASGEFELHYDEVELIQEGRFPEYQLPASTYSARLKDFETYILEKLRARAESIDISEYQILEEDFGAVYRGVINRNPELFYVSSGCYYYTSSGYVVSVLPMYRLEGTSEQVAAFEAKMEEALSLVDDSMTDLEKLIVLHDYLVRNIAYNWNVATGSGAAPDHVYTAYGALVEGDAVCQGYTLAYAALLNRLGIENDYAPSDAMNHIWNLVKLDGRWYHIDVTWDDPVPDGVGAGKYTYFLLSDATISDAEHKHHSWNTQGILVCNSTKYESTSYVFRNTPTLTHYDGDDFYYLNDSDYYLYRTESLDNAGEQFSQEALTRLYYRNGMVWLGDRLYYVARNIVNYEYAYQLTMCDLNTGVVETLLTFAFEQSPSADGCYQSGYDDAGLRYDAATHSLHVTSATRPNQVWVYSLDDDQPLMLLRKGNDVVVTVAAGDANRTGWVAFYQGDKMTAIRKIPGLDETMQTVTIDTDGISWDTAKAFLVSSDTFAPVCTERSVKNAA